MMNCNVLTSPTAPEHVCLLLKIPLRMKCQLKGSNGLKIWTLFLGDVNKLECGIVDANVTGSWWEKEEEEYGVNFQFRD